MVWVLGLVFTVWFQLACANNQNNAKYPSKDGDAEVQVLKSWYATNAMGVFIWMSPKNILPQSHTCIAILQTQNLACNIVLLQRWAETVAKGWSCGSHASEAWVEKIQQKQECLQTYLVIHSVLNVGNVYLYSILESMRPSAAGP